MPATEHIILVDQNDQPIGTLEKLTAHRLGLRHRAFSVFLFRETPYGLDTLLQQRAAQKYHSPHLWTNTCCSHPHSNEKIIQAGERRLFEEMGIKTTLQSAGKFHYFANFGNGLSENEIDHVLIAMANLEPTINSNEVEQFRWVKIDDLKQELLQKPQNFTAWFPQAFEMALQKIASLFPKNF